MNFNYHSENLKTYQALESNHVLKQSKTQRIGASLELYKSKAASIAPIITSFFLVLLLVTANAYSAGRHYYDNDRDNNKTKSDTLDIRLRHYIESLPDTTRAAFQAHLDTLYNDSVVLFFPQITSSYDYWNNFDIHSKKYDFSYAIDTVTIVLQDSNSNYVHPWHGNVTSRFGKRKYRWHYGIDVNLEKGDSVRNAFNGKVRISKYSKTYGHVIVVRHENGLETLYAHLSKSLAKVGDTLKAGDVVGLGGNTGRSYGSHLHFEVRYMDEAINPEDIIDFTNGRLKSDTLCLTKNNYEYMSEIRELLKIKWHIVRRGDTLSHIASRYGTSVSTLCSLNGISRNSILRIGQRIRFR